MNKSYEIKMGKPGELRRLTDMRAKFLSFLRRRVDEQASAEDILQSAYIKAIEHGSEIRADENTVAWFYRILRNAITDNHRRVAARMKAQDTFSADAFSSYEPEIAQTACACVGDVIQQLKRDYRVAIERVDLGGETVEAFAQSIQITANNASVRLHRARRAVVRELTKVCGACAEHKCLDCTCRRSQV